MILFLACIAGPSGERGERGPAGEPGERGEAASEPFWRPLWGWEDANGDPALPTERLEYLDQQGLLWQVNPETALLQGVPVSPLFETDDCSGAALVASQDLPAPRIVFSTPDLFAWVRRGDSAQQAATALVASVEVRGDAVLECRDAWTGARRAVLRLDSMLAVEPPWLGWAAPLHPAGFEPV